MTAYEEGRIAQRQGRSIRECPYFESRHRWSWLEGWYDAQRQELEDILEPPKNRR